jgi:hypothetical protein
MEYSEYTVKLTTGSGKYDITRPVGEVFRDVTGKLMRVDEAIGDGESIESLDETEICSKCYYNNKCVCFENKTWKDNTRGECRNYKRSDNTQVYYSEVKSMHINFMEE